MDFFKSVFSDDPSASSSESEHPSSEDTQNPDAQIPAITNAWSFGSTLLKTIATKSESVIENYKQEFEDFSTGLKNESAIVREAASRAVKDLPARLETGAVVAQNSLESIGGAIDTIESTVSVIITQGKDSIFNANDEDSDSESMENNGNNSDNISKPDSKPYSRVDALIKSIQCDMKTYCEEPEEAGEYESWKKGFILEENGGEIDGIIDENRVIGEIYNEVVPEKVDHETFWSRYFFKIYRVRKAEEARIKLVKRAREGEEEEELSWDVDDDEEDIGLISKEDEPDVKENVEKSDNTILHKGDEGSPEECESKVKSDNVIEGKSNENESRNEKVSAEGKSNENESRNEKGKSNENESRNEKGKSNENESRNEKVSVVLDDKVSSSEGKNDNIRDYSVISSQRSSHEEVDIGWDEIEDIGSGDEGKAAAKTNPVVGNSQQQQKRMNVAEEDEEDLTWDIEDDDDDDNDEEPNKVI